MAMSDFFILTWVPFPRFTTGEYVSDFDMIREEVKVRLSEFDSGQLEDMGFFLPEWDPDGDQDKDNEIARATALADIEDTFNHFFINAHDHTVRGRLDNGRDHIFAGGMARDETPSDAYDALSRLTQTDVFDRLFGWGDQVTV